LLVEIGSIRAVVRAFYRQNWPRDIGQLTDAPVDRNLVSKLTMISQAAIEVLSDSELIASTRELLRQSRWFEAELLVHLGEIDERELYLDRAFSSMFAFCVSELGLSESAAYTRIHVARSARALPAMIEALRSGAVHLTALRLLGPHLTPENHRDVLARAAGKKKDGIEELVAALAPRLPVPTILRKIPSPPCAPAPLAQPAPTATSSGDQPALPGCEQSGAVARPDEQSAVARPDEQTGAIAAPGPGEQSRAVVAPLSQDFFKVQFTGTRAFRDKLRKAQGLLRHRFLKGDVGPILELALDALIERVEKDRFAMGRKPRRKATSNDGATAKSRHIPNAIKREVYARDGGRCTFEDASGRRCDATDALEYDHIDGFARVQVHSADRIRLLCRAHNQHAAEKMYGRALVERARATSAATRSGTSSPARPPERSDPLLL
jgi:hypothetical protein